MSKVQWCDQFIVNLISQNKHIDTNAIKMYLQHMQTHMQVIQQMRSCMLVKYTTIYLK